ncbi:MAG: FG-GAP repeat protein, partial [Romboutsia sp.]|nr:FG-GAP repeat protein [Romboutsia sp.]
GGPTINNIPNMTIEGEAQFDHMGNTVSGAGDLNDDGYNDFVIGGRGYNNFQGKAKIYFGAENITNLDSVVLVGELEQSLFSEYISSGDINNDGFSDLVISAHNYSSPTGRVYIYFGSSNFDTEVITITGEGKGNLFGVKVAGSGDINNDGFDDFIVGAPGYNSSTGAAYLYLGNNELNNNYDLFLKGTTTMSGFGGVISFLGDINNDGYQDFIIGERKKTTIYYGSNEIDSLKTKVLLAINDKFGFGGSLSAAGDLNNDGYQDILIGGETINTDSSRAYIYYGGNIINDKPDVILSLGNYNDSFGCRVSTAGDLNNDNYDDIMISATGYSGSKGAVLIYYGGETINEKPDVMLVGEKSNDYFGNSISKVGDVNRDGFPTLLIEFP